MSRSGIAGSYPDPLDRPGREKRIDRDIAAHKAKMIAQAERKEARREHWRITHEDSKSSA